MYSIPRQGELDNTFLRQTRDFNYRETHTPSSALLNLHACSSHANDLALQIAEEVTGHSEVVVLDGAYHGHTKPLMGLSTYKSRQQKEGESGIGSNPHAWIVSMGMFLVTNHAKNILLRNLRRLMVHAAHVGILNK